MILLGDLASIYQMIRRFHETVNSDADTDAERIWNPLSGMLPSIAVKQGTSAQEACFFTVHILTR